jgi:hypothetical protein
MHKYTQKMHNYTDYKMMTKGLQNNDKKFFLMTAKNLLTEPVIGAIMVS